MGEHKRKKKKFIFSKSKQSKSKLSIWIIVLCFCAIATYDFIQRQDRSVIADYDPARSKGSPEAPIKIIEFVDFQCQECARGSRVLASYLKKYPEGIHLTLKYYPLGEFNSTISAVHAQCAAMQNRFWSFHDELFKKQDQWRDIYEIKSYLRVMAQSVGIDLPKLDACVEDGQAKAVVFEEKTLGDSYFIRSTPSYFINGELVVGVESMEEKLTAFFEHESEDLL